MKKIRIGFLVNTMYSDYAVSFITGLRKFCKEQDFELFIFPVLKGVSSTRFSFQYDTNLRFINPYNIDVLILSSGALSNYISKDDYSKTLNSFSVPMISAGFEMEGLPSIVVNSEKSIIDIINHFVKKHNRKNFLLVRANSRSPESAEREAAFRKALKLNKIEFDEKKIIDADFVYESAEPKLLKYLKKRGNKPDFDAIFCCNDSMAFGCLAVLQKLNIDVPKDVCVAGYDNIDYTDTNKITLTTIDQQTEEQGYEAGKLAIELLRKKQIPLRTKFNTLAIYRESCGCHEKIKREMPHADEASSFLKLYKKGKELDLIHFFLTESQEPLSLSRIGGRLEYSFNLFDISAAVIAIYEKPIFNTGIDEFKLPEKARMEFCYSKRSGINNPKIVFNPTERIIPKEGKKFISNAQIIFPLNSGNTLYGYMIFSLGKYNMLFYQDMFELISKEIISAIRILKYEQQSEELKRRNIKLSSYSEELYELSRKDELTSLLNRRGFYKEAENAIANTAANSKTGLVIFADMDGLKKINDTFGHDVGDRAIKAATDVLQKTFKSSSIVGRLGGDEFGIVVLDTPKSKFSAIKKSLKQKCDDFNAGGAEKFILSMSAGCVEFNSKKPDLDDLLMAADKLLYAEKKKKYSR